MSRRLAETLAAILLLGVSQVAEACFWCYWYMCSWEVGPGRLHCVSTCYGGTGDPTDNCWCVASGPACWGAQAPGNSSWLASTACPPGSLLSATTPASWTPGAPIVVKQHAHSLVLRKAPSVTTISQSGAAAPGTSPLPKGCAERVGAQGERIVECVAPGYHGPAPADAFSFSADPGLLLQIAEFNKSLAYAVYALQRTSQSSPLDLGGGELFVSVPTDVALVRDVILGRRTARNSEGRAERFEFVRIVAPTGDAFRFQLRSVDDPNGPAIELELMRSDGAAGVLRVVRWSPANSVRKRPSVSSPKSC